MADTVPPQDIDAEKSLLGAILLDRNAITDVASFLRPIYFYSHANSLIFEGMIELFSEGDPIDILTVADLLKRNKKLDKIGGKSYLATLVEDVPSVSNAQSYGHIIRDKYIRRSLITVAGEISSLGINETGTIESALDEAEKKIFDISQSGNTSDFIHIKDLLKSAYENSMDPDNKMDTFRGVPTGFKSIDNILGGLQDSNLVILAARPSVGKSAFALDIARNAALRHNKKVAIFSLEMSNLELTYRLVASEVGVNLWELRMAKIKDASTVEKMGDVYGQLSESSLYLDDTPGQSILEIRTKARRLSVEKKIDLVIIDYLQLISSNRSYENRSTEVADISRSLKNLARELNTPVLALSQLSRSIEQRASKIPQLSDLRESGAIEQDADVVMFINRDDATNPESEKKGIAEIYIAKHRNGPTGMAELFFTKEYARFNDMEKVRKE